ILHREEMRHQQGSEAYEKVKGKANLIIAKQRNGPVGRIPLTWLWKYTRFTPASPREAPTSVPTDDYQGAGAVAGDQEAEPPF
ncbi:unnamed protein product, partial [marine sediment metagenome]